MTRQETGTHPVTTTHLVTTTHREIGNILTITTTTITVATDEMAEMGAMAETVKMVKMDVMDATAKMENVAAVRTVLDLVVQEAHLDQEATEDPPALQDLRVK